MGDTIDDKTGREALDATVRATVELQRELSVPVPSQRLAEEWARPIVEEQIKKTEELRARPKRDPEAELDPALPKARIDREEVGADTRTITRDLGVAEWDLRKNGMLSADPELMRTWRVEKPKEDKLLRARLDFLMTLPDWKLKIEIAVLVGEAQARRRDHIDLKTDAGVKELMSVIADHVIAVADASIPFFGDYRHPKAPSTPKVFG